MTSWIVGFSLSSWALMYIVGSRVWLTFHGRIVSCGLDSIWVSWSSACWGWVFQAGFCLYISGIVFSCPFLVLHVNLSWVFCLIWSESLVVMTISHGRLSALVEIYTLESWSCLLNRLYTGWFHCRLIRVLMPIESACTYGYFRAGFMIAFVLTISQLSCTFHCRLWLIRTYKVAGFMIVHWHFSWHLHEY